VAVDARFDLPPEEALAFFRAKGYALGFAWQDVWQQEHDAAFTVAKMMDLDLLRDTRAAVDKAIAEGQTFQQFRDNLEPTLVKAGWWGKAEMVDPATAEKKLVQLGSTRRLRHIYRNNMQQAYAAGHWQQIEQNKDDAPYLMYDAVDDGRTREEHLEWDGTVLPWNDPWWETHYPPNGHNCRCSVIQLSAEQVRAMGLAVADAAPPVKTRDYTNPRTGEVSQVPEGIDPGFAHRPGASRAGQAAQQFAQKAADAPPEMGIRAMKTLSAAEARAFDAEHARWVDEVLAAQAGPVRSGQRVVGGLDLTDMQAMAARGRPVTSGAIWLDPGLLRGPKAARHEAAGNALSTDDWRALPARLRNPEAVLLDRVDGKLLYVFGAGTAPGSAATAAKIVVEVERMDTPSPGRGAEKRAMNSIRTGFRVQPADLRVSRYELVRGSLP
jgi:SPP1 gp7 family putative phage head morphogenesis protein